jgi:hypothetical protein
LFISTDLTDTKATSLSEKSQIKFTEQSTENSPTDIYHYQVYEKTVSKPITGQLDNHLASTSREHVRTNPNRQISLSDQIKLSPSHHRRRTYEFPTLMRFISWRDVNIESLGYDPRSTYVEKFWLPFIGPSTILLLRRIVESLETNPYGFDLDLKELSTMLGLGQAIGRNSSIQKTLNRLLVFELARVMPSNALSVRLKMPPLPQRYVKRLPLTLQEQHTIIVDSSSSDNVMAVRKRARSLALSLAKLGHDRNSIENQLIAWRFHPSVCYETLHWMDTTSFELPAEEISNEDA